jgi:hypothetical protein
LGAGEIPFFTVNTMAVLFTGPNALMNWPDAIQIPIYIVAPI